MEIILTEPHAEHPETNTGIGNRIALWEENDSLVPGREASSMFIKANASQPPDGQGWANQWWW